MRIRLHRAAQLLLCGIVCITALFLSAAAAQERKETLDCTAFEGSMIDASEGWYWDSKTRTLTLINANIRPETRWLVVGEQLVEDTTVNGIVLPGGSTVVLLGENTVSARAYGVYSTGRVSFVQETLLAPDDLSRMDGSADGTLAVTGEMQAVMVGTLENEGTLEAGDSWYTAQQTSEPGTSRYACFTVPPEIVIDVTDCGVELESDGFYLNQRGVMSEKYDAGGVYTITGASNASSHAVKVHAGQSVEVTLENVQLDLSERRWNSPFILEEGAQAVLILKGENTLLAGTTCAAVQVAEGAVLTVSTDSTGGLRAVGGAGAAGIGGGNRTACGTVSVEGGVIEATGTSGGAGIGQGSGGTGGSFSVTGGQLQLTGGYGAAGFGGGSGGSGGSATVAGGTVTARGGSNAPGIGAGADAQGFRTTVSGGTVAATGGRRAPGVGAGDGASGCTTLISGGTVQAGGGYGAAGIDAGGNGETLTDEEGVIPVQPEDGGTTGAPNTMTVSGGSVSAAAGGGGAAAVGSSVSGGNRVATISAVQEPAFAMPEDDSVQTYTSYLDSLPTEEDVREENSGTDEPDEPDEPGQAMERFDDLQEDAWYMEALDFAAAADLIDAVDGARTFAPDQDATRAVVVEALWRMAGRPETQAGADYDDVPADAPNAAAIAWAQQADIAHGDGDGGFRPSDPITRQEMCAVLARFAAWRGDKLQAALQGDFADADEIALWAREAVYLCRGSGLVVGREDGKFYPKDNVTRAELAQMLFNLEQMHEEEGNDETAVRSR